MMNTTTNNDKNDAAEATNSSREDTESPKWSWGKKIVWCLVAMIVGGFVFTILYICLELNVYVAFIIAYSICYTIRLSFFEKKR